MKTVLELFRKQCVDLCLQADKSTHPSDLAVLIQALPIAEIAKGALVMRPMHSESEPDKRSWYVDLDDVLYCDIEKEADGTYSVFFKDRVSGKDGFGDQADIKQ